jgi:anti-anti-sigma factor
MLAPKLPDGHRLVLSAQETRFGGGAAEAFETYLIRLFFGGCRDIVVDLAGVSSIDSTGIRALGRGRMARRAAGSFRIAAASADVTRA